MSRELAVGFHRELLDLAVAAGDRDSFERLLLDLYDQGVEDGEAAARQRRAAQAVRDEVEQRKLFDLAVRMSERRGQEAKAVKLQLAAAQAELAQVRAELEDHQFRLVDARVAS